MFFHFPFIGWIVLLLAAIIGLQLSDYEHIKHYQDSNIAKNVEKEFNKRLDQIEHLKDEHLRSESGIIEFVLEDSNLISWNCYELSIDTSFFSELSLYEKGTIKRLQHSDYFVTKKEITTDSSKTQYVRLIPLHTSYPIENDYFRSQYHFEKDIPEGTYFELDSFSQRSYPIKSTSGDVCFFLRFTHDTSIPSKPSNWSVTFYCFIFLTGCIWIHKIGVYVGGKQGYWKGLGLISILLFCFLSICKFLLCPVALQQMHIFSPDFMAPVFGGIDTFPTFLSVIFISAWFHFYIVRFANFGQHRFLKHRIGEIFLRLTLAILLLSFSFYINNSATQTLYFNSKISFEIGNFGDMDSYAFLGVFLSLLMILMFACCVVASKLLIRHYFPKRIISNLSIVAYLFIFHIFTKGDEAQAYPYAIIVFAFLTTILADFFPFYLFQKKNITPLSTNITGFIWLFFITFWGACQLFYFNFEKERNIRQLFATRQLLLEDPLVSFNLQRIKKDLQNDTTTEAISASDWLHYLKELNIEQSFKHYEVDYFIFDANEQLITADLELSSKITGYNDETLNTSKVLFIEDESEVIYWIYVPIGNCSTSQVKGIGIQLRQQAEMGNSLLQALLKPNYNRADRYYFDRYSFLIFKQGKLIKQRGLHTSSTWIPSVGNNKEFVYHEQLKYSILEFRPDEETVVVVLYSRNILLNAILLFMYYMVVVLAALLIFYFLYYVGFSSNKPQPFKPIHLTLTRKIYWTITGSVFVIFVVVSYVSVSFISSIYKESQRQQRLQQIQLIANSITQDSYFTFSQENSKVTLNNTLLLSELLSNLSAEQNIAIRLYDLDGRLQVSSQQSLLNAGYISSLMHPRAFRILNSNTADRIILPENIGRFNYDSYYMPIRNKQEQFLIAYLNVIDYTSGGILKKEMLNMSALLVSVYTFIFFLSIIIAIFITANVSKSFHLLIQQFRQVRLSKNELLTWPYKDEVGLLVKEYNIMIKKVEEMAKILAKTERETAWREIAKQVAHEIKNPLTPMKLNIQYLQMSIKNKRDNVAEMTEKITHTLIEQIDSLDVIASEFSSFAKMPHPQPESFLLNEALASVVRLYEKEKNITFYLNLDCKDKKLFMDKSYFIRIFSNIIKNACQAIETDNQKQGTINVRCEKAENKQLVKIEIEDNGIGISDEQMERLFIPHFTTKSQGSGLGLAMTKNMIELSEGKISVKSELGKGSIFCIELPFENKN